MGRANEAAGPQYGRRLIPNVIDQLARDEPDREAFQIPRSQNPQDGWTSVTFRQYADAISLQAHEIVKSCGKAPDGAFPTLAYIGSQDARYVVFLVSAVKAGYQALFVSTRNAAGGQLSLFAETGCHVLFCDGSYKSAADAWRREREMAVVEVKPCEAWFGGADVQHFPYDKTFDEAEWDPLCVLHTSGSTGHPKPVVVRNGMIAIGDACHNLGEWQGCQHWVRAWMEGSKRHFIPMPLFHAAALYVYIISVIWWKTPVALGLGDRALTADLATECLRNLEVESAALPPSVLEEMSQDSQGLDALRKLKMVPIGGELRAIDFALGSLAGDVGDYLVRSGVVLCNLLNSTEFTPFPLYFQTRPELWQYFVINSELFGCDWRAAGGNVYELVVVRKGKHPGLQGFFYTFPDLDEVSTHDLFEPHPTLPNHWKYRGRADHILVFSNGEKLNPVTMEGIVQAHPAVKGALVVAGASRFQPGLLIEPITQPCGESEERALIEELWPQVARANRETVAHGQVAKEFVAVTAPGKAFCRAGKGTVQRAATLAAHAREIEQLYQRAERALPSDGPLPLLDRDPAALGRWIVRVLMPHMRGGADMDHDTNFFSAGMDSLQVLNAARKLRAGLEAAGHSGLSLSHVSRGIYNHPTAGRLSGYVRGLVFGPGDGATLEDADAESREVDVMRSLYERYTRDLGKSDVPKRPEAPRDNQVVLLTGSTGTLGAELLDRLLRSPTVARVVCLNRAGDGGRKQQVKAMKARGSAGLDLDRVEFHHMQVSEARLGLPDHVYSRLLVEVARVIHCAWPVNFNLSTESFEPHLCGVRRLCDFASAAARRVAVLFLSSVSTADKWDPSHGPVPEQRIQEWSLPSNGYGRSKMLGSLILEDAGIVCDFPAASIRIGQIAGSESESESGGPWNANEWLPSIIASSLHLSALPGDLGRANRVDWVPLERVAKLVAEISCGVESGLSMHAEEQTHGYFHCVNPSSTTWQDLLPAVRGFYGNRVQDVVSFREWVARLEASQADGDGEAETTLGNPGLKLIDTYRSMVADPASPNVVFAMARTNECHGAMRGSQAITPELMRHWCRQWGF
ncbi:uncharacterized protein PG986_002330 [Apiospora aurea]|uniref:Carrier domain-containing protein n=1 Tax=Apiospora aurea TaxID=335848 RepID=A0ABR1QZG0_9PEZI